MLSRQGYLQCWLISEHMVAEPSILPFTTQTRHLYAAHAADFNIRTSLAVVIKFLHLIFFFNGNNLFLKFHLSIH